MRSFTYRKEKRDDFIHSKSALASDELETSGQFHKKGAFAEPFTIQTLHMTNTSKSVTQLKRLHIWSEATALCSAD